MRVKELIRDGVIACRANEPITCAVTKMYINNVGSVLIVDDDGRPQGIFTERDLVRVIAENISLDTPLSKVMSRKLITATPSESVISAAMKMIENNIRHLPVIEEGRAVGVVSIRDIIRALMAQELAYP
ncbi:MAG: CBS domain-containing protein [Vulcanisaeta sp.]|jgi:CBS domain-containing protein|nr:CBS domain-containing protein [Vulcanisaeta sp.]MCG2869760.1 CBS domain-containing protein [Vulcanisaeta sp.]MCG2879921.1 CBS domain-containing protein [Vulcanisaeta sp.]MCG2887553.1 CBS domain-containing protein [Vulcanisaeta sp.]MCG2894847.1 CBS domain-containing protein [Vulcanisaeta sp.]